jgi:hypothetical protein
MSINERVNKLKVINRKVIDSYFIAEQCWQVLEPLLYEKDVYSNWDGTEGVVAVKVVRMALFTSIMVDLHARVFDAGPKAGSLHNVISGLRDNGVKSLIREQFCIPKEATILSDHSEDELAFLKNSFREEQIAEKESIFDRVYGEVLSEYEALECSDLVSGLKSARDKIFAHSELRTLNGERVFFESSDFGVRFKDAHKLLQSVESIVFGANLLLTNSSYAMDGFLEHSKKVSSEYWNKVRS